MTTNTATLHRINIPLAGAITFAVASALMAKAYLVGEDHNTVGEYAICVGIILVATAITFGVALPRVGNRGAWILAALAVITLPVFWLGLPLVFGAAAALTGRAGPQILGGIAFLATVGAVVSGM